MSSTWKTVRVFISSTFRNMHAERDHLVKVVFPKLRQWCAERRTRRQCVPDEMIPDWQPVGDRPSQYTSNVTQLRSC